MFTITRFLLYQGSFTYILLIAGLKKIIRYTKDFLTCKHFHAFTCKHFLTLESHGKSFFQGVRFSVQTSSLGSAACLKRLEFVPKSEEIPSLLNESLGLVVVLLSMKLSEAQN